MKENKLKVIFRGGRCRVFTENGTELGHIVSVRVNAERKAPTLMLEFADFELDSQVSADTPSPELLARFGLTQADFEGRK
ncbi:MAG: hypothetical protein WDA26_00060 [Pusillimonas sp.]